MQNTKTELMKIYYDSCQSTVALRKQHKLLMQHITSQGSRLAPLKLRRPLASSSAQGGRILYPHVSLCTLASSSPGVMWGVDAGRTVPARCLPGPSTPHWSLTGLRRFLPPLDAPTNSALCALGSRLLYKNNMQFYGAHRLPRSSSFSSLAAEQRVRDKTLQGVLDVLMRRPSDGIVHTLKHGSWWRTKMLQLLISPQMERTERRASLLLYGVKGGRRSCCLY